MRTSTLVIDGVKVRVTVDRFEREAKNGCDTLIHVQPAERIGETEKWMSVTHQRTTEDGPTKEQIARGMVRMNRAYFKEVSQ